MALYIYIFAIYSIIRKNNDDGRVVIVFVPIIRNENKFIEVIKTTPLLESVRKSYKVMKLTFYENNLFEKRILK